MQWYRTARQHSKVEGPPARSRCRCGRGLPGPDADVAGVSTVPVQMWQRVSTVPVQMWQGVTRSRCRCGGGEHGPGADVAREQSDGRIPPLGAVPLCRRRLAALLRPKQRSAHPARPGQTWLLSAGSRAAGRRSSQRAPADGPHRSEQSHARANARTHARTHTHAHARTHARTHVHLSLVGGAGPTRLRREDGCDRRRARACEAELFKATGQSGYEPAHAAHTARHPIRHGIPSGTVPHTAVSRTARYLVRWCDAT
jgi:hypothetical protein